MAQTAASSGGTAESGTKRGTVVVSSPDHPLRDTDHEAVSWIANARRLAALKGFDFAGEYDPSVRYEGPIFFVPSQTLVGIEVAKALGIHSERDLFGGVVPYPFVATKAITHPLVEPDAAAPVGWSAEFGHRVRGVVLSGYSVFTPDDARRAAGHLLEQGGVRIKPVRETGGRGQSVISELAGLEVVLAATDAADLACCGLVLEENLTDVTTASVGQGRVAGLVATYYGTQRLTRDNGGATVYGGSDLLVVRGGYDVLLGVDLPEEARLAVAQAREYETAAMACFPGLFMSRCNYDIAQGLDSRGRKRSGVLEQSWRVGGASSAEIAALEAFKADPALRAVRASTVEIYGESDMPPPHATVYFRGEDEKVGFITKYTTVESYGNT